MKLLNLVVRDVEAITELARLDLVLVPAANVLARAVFEIAVKAAWMVTPDDPFDREVRWLAHLEEEERMHDRIAGKVTRLGGNPANLEKDRDTIKRFRKDVERVLPAGYSPLPGNPSVEQMLEDIGQKQVYSFYTLLCAYVHGGHASTSLYRRNLGTFREDGEFIEPGSWHLALWMSWKNFQVICPYVLERLGATGHDYISDAQEIESALGRLSSEKINKTVVM